MLDAIRTKDGQPVTLKRIPGNSTNELQTHRHLLESAPDGIDSKAKDTIVPILDEFTFSDDEDSDNIVVMPYLRPSSDPSCETVQDVVNFLESAFKVRTMATVAHASNLTWSRSRACNTCIDVESLIGVSKNSTLLPHVLSVLM